MKIFNRGTDAKPAPAAPAAQLAPSVAPAQAGQSVPPAAEAAAPAEPAAAPAPDLALVLDANVKEMSEKIARLASNLESAQEERTGFEAKIEQMEERMRKLSSLTEMISAQYNPFVGDAPSEREAMPRPEVGLAPPAVVDAPSMEIPPPPSEAPPEPALSLSLEPPAPEPPVEQERAPAPVPEPVAGPAAPAHALPAEAQDVYLWHIAPGFEASMLLLGWADMLLRSAGSRESLLELVNYYHNIGWIGDPARDQILAYSDGLAMSDEAAPRDWRADVEVHEKSLLFVEKLRAVTARGGG